MLLFKKRTKAISILHSLSKGSGVLGGLEGSKDSGSLDGPKGPWVLKGPEGPGSTKGPGDIRNIEATILAIF